MLSTDDRHSLQTAGEVKPLDNLESLLLVLARANRLTCVCTYVRMSKVHMVHTHIAGMDSLYHMQ